MNEPEDGKPGQALLALLQYAREEALRIGLDEAAQLIELPMCSIHLQLQADAGPTAPGRPESAS